MIGAVIIVLVCVVVLPVLFMMGGAVIAALVGWSAKSTAEHDHAGSELVDLNV